MNKILHRTKRKSITNHSSRSNNIRYQKISQSSPLYFKKNITIPSTFFDKQKDTSQFRIQNQSVKNIYLTTTKNLLEITSQQNRSFYGAPNLRPSLKQVSLNFQKIRDKLSQLNKTKIRVTNLNRTPYLKIRQPSNENRTVTLKFKSLRTNNFDPTRSIQFSQVTLEKLDEEIKQRKIFSRTHSTLKKNQLLQQYLEMKTPNYIILNFWEQQKEEGLFNERSFCLFFEFLSKNDQFLQLNDALQEMENLECDIGVMTFETLWKIYFKKGLLDNGLIYWKKASQYRPSIFYYENALQLLVPHGATNIGLYLWNEIKQRNLSPTKKIFNSLVSIFKNDSQQNLVFKFIKMMKIYGFNTDNQSERALVQSFHTTKKKAIDLLKELEEMTLKDKKEENEFLEENLEEKENKFFQQDIENESEFIENENEKEQIETTEFIKGNDQYQYYNLYSMSSSKTTFQPTNFHKKSSFKYFKETYSFTLSTNIDYSNLISNNTSKIQLNNNFKTNNDNNNFSNNFTENIKNNTKKVPSQRRFFSSEIFETIIDEIPKTRFPKKNYLATETYQNSSVSVLRTIGEKNLLIDPFLLLDEILKKPKSQFEFPDFPNVGFDTVTYLISGKIFHKDSLKNFVTLEKGDLQLMTAGKGIVCEKKFDEEESVRAIQLWINLPSNLKMCEPKVLNLKSKDFPIFEENGIKIKILSGKYNNLIGPIPQISTDPIFFHIELESEKNFNYSFDPSFECFIYILEGEATLGEKIAKKNEIVTFTFGSSIQIENKSKSLKLCFLFLAGKPIKENICTFGPFVMNTNEEVRKACNSFQNGKFI